MHNNRLQKLLLRITTAFVLSAVLLAICPTARAQSQNWWTLPQQTGAVERGKLEELKTKKKVYVSVTYDNNLPGQVTSASEKADIQKSVLKAVSSHKGLTVVLNPASAEFAVLVRIIASPAAAEAERPGNFSVALDPDAEIGVEVNVVVPGAKLADGSFKPRTVWQNSSPNVQTEAAPGASFVVGGFLWELKKLKDAK
jgi:hypothetical protein